MPAVDVTTTSTATAVAYSAPPTFEGFLTLGLYVLIATGLILLLLVLARFLGQRSFSEVKGQPYESAVLPTGDSRLRQAVPFYLVAIFFIIFDLEAIFVVSWAVAYDLLGWAGFWQISFFIGILFLGLIYLWKMGGLDWGSTAVHERIPARRRG